MSVAEALRSDSSGRGAAFSGAEGGGELTIVEPLIFEASRPERRAVRFPSASDAAREAASAQPAPPRRLSGWAGFWLNVFGSIVVVLVIDQLADLAPLLLLRA